MPPAETGPAAQGSRFATVLSAVSCVVGAAAVLGLVVLGTQVSRLHDRLAGAATRTELARLARRVGDAEKRATALANAARARSITAEQRTAIVRSLSGFPGEKVEVEVFNTSYETAAFAEQVGSTLSAAGLAAHVSPVIGTFAPWQGLTIAVKDASKAPAVAGRIASAFRAAGVPMAVVVDEDLDSGACVIRVGERPAL